MDNGSWSGYMAYCNERGFAPDLNLGSETQPPDDFPMEDTEVPETEPLAMPTRNDDANPLDSMTLDQLLRAPGRDKLKKIDPSRMNGTTWYRFDKGFTKIIKKIMESDFPELAPNITSVSGDTKKRWFKAFARNPETGEYPDMVTFMEETHKRKSDGTFVDKKAEAIARRCREMEKEKLTQMSQHSDTPDDYQLTQAEKTDIFRSCEFESSKISTMYLPEPVTVMVFERLRIRDIAKLRSVCREWKSSYFRDLYRTINHRNLSSPWSILYRDQYSNTPLEFFYEKWGLKQSLGSCVSRFLHEVKAANNNKRMGALAITDGLILLGVSTNFGPNMFCVVNPVLRQWIKIPQPPPCSSVDGFLGAGLVTDMNNGDLLGYKVVRAIGLTTTSLLSVPSTGASHQIPLVLMVIFIGYAVQLKSSLLMISMLLPNFVVSSIDLPQGSAKTPGKGEEETLTISCGSLMYMNIDTGRPNQQLKIWRLKNYTMADPKRLEGESWELLWNLMPGLDLGLATVPVAMHPFDKEIVYLVTCQTRFSRKHAYLVSGNLGTKKFQLHKGWKQRHREFGDYQSHLFHQFVLPQRLGSFPCPPGCTLVTLPDPH
ncbi:unnamed protein product [Arabidopsis lyrata]|nr:unnamed protein product [Arabidopsis lyrata]